MLDFNALFWRLILTLDFDAWFWHLILTLDFDAWFWRLILTLDFELVSQTDIQMDGWMDDANSRVASQLKSKKSALSLKVGSKEIQNYILFEKKSSDMKSRCKNQFWFKTIEFIEKCFLNEVILWILYVYWSIWYIFQLDFGPNRVFSESNLGILCHYFLGVGR